MPSDLIGTGHLENNLRLTKSVEVIFTHYSPKSPLPTHTHKITYMYKFIVWYYLANATFTRRAGTAGKIH